MAEHGWNDLQYGHFGNAAYNTHEQTWYFRRTADQSCSLRPLGEPVTFAPCTGIGDSSVESTAEFFSGTASIRHERQIKDLVRAHPDLQPGTSLLGPLLQTSEAIESAASRHDPVKGKLLSYARIYDEAIRRSTRFIAFATGLSGSDLQIVQIQLQKQGWDDSRDIWLEVPVLGGVETTWKTGGPPIQQILFAQPIESGESLLALRLITRTLIMKPILRKHGPARLDVNILSEISVERTGDAPHADVAFNPWLTRQFAIVDQHAGWSVWEFESGKSTDVKRIHYAIASEGGSERVGQLNDGWARIMWTYNPSTILVANRRHVALFDITAGPVKLSDLNVGLSGATGWVLDIATFTSRKNSIFVLTTTHLFLFYVEEVGGEIQANVKALFRHYRSSEEITLRLSILEDGEDVTIALRSAQSPIISLHHLNFTEPASLTLHEPSLLNILPRPSDRTAISSLIDIDFQSISLASNSRGDSGHSTAARIRNDGGQFALVTTLMGDLSVRQQLYTVNDLRGTAQDVTSPSWKGRPPASTSKLRDDFLIDDGNELFSVEHRASKLEPVPAFRQRRKQSIRARAGLDWTVHYELCARRMGTEGEDVLDVDHIIDCFRSLVENPQDHEFLHMQTLREFANAELTTSDIDGTSARVSEMSRMQASKRPVVHDGDMVERKEVILLPLMESSQALEADSTHGQSLASLYDSVVAQWISTLPQSVPARVRLAKEQLARRLAIEVTLASHTIRVKEAEKAEDLPPQHLSDDKSQRWDLPVRGIGSSQVRQSNGATALLSQPQEILPTPSPTATPSITTSSSRTSAFAAAEVSRLSKYTTFSKPAPAMIPRSLNRILSHWSIGTDPESYDWLNTSRQITQQLETEEADSQLTERERARLQRKAERHIRRQRKEAAASQQQQMVSSQMPELVVSASQPIGRSVGAEHSAQAAQTARSVAGSSQSITLGTASQAVAGKYGGRAPARKKRKQGF